MSALTDKMTAALVKIAQKLGEGLTATLITDPTAVYDESTSRYVTPVGDLPVEFTFECAPPAAPKDAAGGGDEGTRVQFEVTMPGTATVPVRGQRLRIRGAVYQVLRVEPIEFGDGIAGYVLGVAL